ncbi:MAG TPA: hypothetical protein VN706_14630 [Gemmatimonadaceae bacterium]|nr:hypothetical protein [Gemmatimonadaceae bacterium]
MQRTPLTIAAFALAIVAATARGQAPIVGWTVTRNTTTDSGKGPSSMAMRQQITPRYLRTEFAQISGARDQSADAEGMYMIFDSVDSTVTMVMPNQHMATIIGLGMVGSTMKNATADIKKLTTSGNHMSTGPVENLGAGERILGHATRHYRNTFDWTMQVGEGEQGCTRHTTGVEETWIAPDVDLESAADNAMAKTMGKMFGDMDDMPDDTRVTAATPKGSHLRTIKHSQSTDADGRPISVTTTDEIVELSHGPLADSLFHAPAGFRVMDMRSMMKDLNPDMLASMAPTARLQDALCGKKTP